MVWRKGDLRLAVSSSVEAGAAVSISSVVVEKRRDWCWVGSGDVDDAARDGRVDAMADGVNAKARDARAVIVRYNAILRFIFAAILWIRLVVCCCVLLQRMSDCLCCCKYLVVSGGCNG